jgi:hypothetical protein
MANGHVKAGIHLEIAHLEIARQLNILRITVSRQWASMSRKLAGLLCNHPGEEEHAVIKTNADVLFGDGKLSRKKGKYKYNQEELLEVIRDTPFKKRRSVRKLASRVGIPYITMNKCIHPRLEGEDPLIKQVVSKLKTMLTDKNKET